MVSEEHTVKTMTFVNSVLILVLVEDGLGEVFFMLHAQNNSKS